MEVCPDISHREPHGIPAGDSADRGTQIQGKHDLSSGSHLLAYVLRDQRI